MEQTGKLTEKHQWLKQIDFTEKKLAKDDIERA